MRTLCDSCEAAAAQFFCAADEAALCAKCDEKVHGCNKLASRHVRLQLRESWSVPRCDICETAGAFLHCSIDGSSLCLQCDMEVHVGGKRTHVRYLLLGQRVEVHGCNKLASRHVRLQLRESWSVPRCDICETAGAFLHCSIDGSSLCLQCDMEVHVGGKRTHVRYLLLGQRVELSNGNHIPNGNHIRDEQGNPKTMDTARAWQNKYCQEHRSNGDPSHKTNISNGNIHNVVSCNKENVQSNGQKD